MEETEAQLYKAKEEATYGVEFIDTILWDTERSKELPIRVYYPTPKDNREVKGVLPVVVFSHGLMGSREGYQPWGEYMAGRGGYVSIHPTHADSFWVVMQEEGALHRFAKGFPAGMKAQMEIERSSPSRWCDRAADVSLVWDRLEEIEEVLKVRKGVLLNLDREKLGVAGHSYGAYTAQLIGGAQVALNSKKEDPSGSLTSLGDARVKATLLLCPRGSTSSEHPEQNWGLTEDSWTSYLCPLMVLTGTKDLDMGQSQEDGMALRTQPYEKSTKEPKYKVIIEGADHGMGGFSPPVKSAAESNRMMGWQVDSGHVQLVMTLSLGFLDAHVKGDQSAIEFLAHQTQQQRTSSIHSFERK